MMGDETDAWAVNPLAQARFLQFFDMYVPVGGTYEKYNEETAEDLDQDVLSLAWHLAARWPAEARMSDLKRRYDEACAAAAEGSIGPLERQAVCSSLVEQALEFIRRAVSPHYTVEMGHGESHTLTFTRVSRFRSATTRVTRSLEVSP